MLKKNSYLVMALFFLLMGISFYPDSGLIFMILIWSSSVFVLFWALHFLKVNLKKDYGPFLVRDSVAKYIALGAILWPFYAIKYLSIFAQSLGKEGPISQVTENLYIGQQLLWFHKKLFQAKKLSAVLDITAESCEPMFLCADKTIPYLKIPLIDKTSPTVKQLEDGVVWGVSQINHGRNLYVHCGAGHERSAVYVAGILLRMGDCSCLNQAIAKIRHNRPKACFAGDQEVVLEGWFKGR